MTYEEAKRVFPRLQPVQFRKSDPNGDGLIGPNEFPLLANFYWMIYVQPTERAIRACRAAAERR